MSEDSYSSLRLENTPLTLRANVGTMFFNLPGSVALSGSGVDLHGSHLSLSGCSTYAIKQNHVFLIHVANYGGSKIKSHPASVTYKIIEYLNILLYIIIMTFRKLLSKNEKIIIANNKVAGLK